MRKAPPVYRPQPIPKVLQRKVSGHGPSAAQRLGRAPVVRCNHVANTIQRAEEKPPPEELTPAQKRAMQQLRRQARATTTTRTGNAEADREADLRNHERIQVTRNSLPILEQLKTDNAVTTQIGKTGARVKFDYNAGLGETNREGGPTGNPVISLGNPALTSLEMGRITLRHELDHAKLQVDGKTLKLGSYVASYQGRAPDQRIERDTFEYRLEELIVRLRDWRRLKNNQLGPAPEYNATHAQARIKQEFANLCNAKDIDEYDLQNVADIMRKLRAIAAELEVDLK